MPRQVLTISLLVVGCSADDVRGDYFDVTFKGVTDECSGGPALFDETLEYRVIVEGQGVEVAVGPDVFATGTANGCDISYTSVVWTEERNDFRVSWQIAGFAVVNLGGAQGCPLEGGLDWLGEETFEIITSEDPSLRPGCTYTSSAEGVYLETIQ